MLKTLSGRRESVDNVFVSLNDSVVRSQTIVVVTQNEKLVRIEVFARRGANRLLVSS